MASDLQTKTVPKFETFVESQLAKVRRRMRALDVGAAALLLPAVALGYLVVTAIFDLAVGGGEEGWILGVRLGMFGLFLLTLGYCGYILVARMMRNINPHYAARQLEQTIPDAKNSVINWLDLKEERLPAAIRSSLGQRAARDLNEADPEQVLDTRPNVMLGTVVGVLFLILLVIFAMSPGQFGSLLARAFAPFRDIALAQRATITLVKPAGGDAVIPHNQGIEISAQIEGRFPRVNQAGAPTLHYRYDQAVDVYRIQPLEEDPNGNWTAKVPADLVQTGFWYRLTAGDAATPEYQVEVRSAPHAVRYEITYKYRPYLLVSEETVVFPNQQTVFPEVLAHRGTEVTLTVRANQTVRDGSVQLVLGNAKDPRAEQVIGAPVPDDPRAFRCTWVLKKSGHFQVFFKSERGESNTDTSSYKMQAIEDGVPIVALDKPGQDVALPANGTLMLEGKARDDFGVTSMNLKMRVLEGGPRELADKPYRPEKAFKFETGGYPSLLEYRDFVALEKLATPEGQPFPLAAGMVLEYWLEATDNSDYPEAAGNVGRSKAFKVKIEPPQEDQKKQQEQRQQAEQKQKEHEQRQDQKQQQENDQKKQEAADKGKTPDEKRAEDMKNQVEKTAKDLKDKLDKQKDQEKQKNQGEAKGEDTQKCESKGNGGGQPQQASAKDHKDQKDQQDPKSDAKQQAGANKQEGPKGDEKNPDTQAAQSKDQGSKDSKLPDLKDEGASQAKNQGADQKPGASAKGGDKDENVNPQNQNANQNQNASDKGAAKDQPKEQSAQSKDQGPKSSEKQQAQAKDNSPDGDKSPEKKDKGGQAKSGDSNKEAPSPQAKSDKKEPMNSAGKKADSKPGSNQQITNEKGSDKGKPPQTASKSPPGSDKDGQQRPAQAKGSEEPKSKAQAKSSPQNDKASDQKQGPPAQAKGQPENKGLKPQPPGTDKQTPGDNTKDSAVAKDNRPGDKKGGEKQAGKAQPPTMKDLERLKEQLAKGDPQALKEAEKLAKELDNIKEPQVRKQAEELLQEAAKKMPKDDAPPMNAKDGPMKDKGMTDQDGPMKQEPMTAQKDGQPKDKGGDGQGDKQKPKDGKEPSNTGKSNGSGPNAAGPQDKLQGTDPNKDFASRGGDLQLEDLKKRMTPEMRKAAGISDEEWSNFLEKAQAYEQMRRKLQNQPKNAEPTEKRGAASQLQNVAPRQVQNLGGNVNPLDAGLAQPPPELRDAQRRFNQYNTP